MPVYHDIFIDTSIKIKCINRNEALMLIETLNPDNINLPACLDLNMRLNDETFVIDLRYRKKNNVKENNINTLINTIDEIMEHIALARDVIKND